MERLTHEKVKGINAGYWSGATREDLIDRLGRYEDVADVEVIEYIFENYFTKDVFEMALKSMRAET